MIFRVWCSLPFLTYFLILLAILFLALLCSWRLSALLILLCLPIRLPLHLLMLLSLLLPLPTLLLYSIPLPRRRSLPAPLTSPLLAYLSAPRLPAGPVGAGPFPSSTPSRFPSQAHTPAVSFAPPPPLSVSAPARPPPFWTSFSAASASQASFSSSQGSAGVHGLGMGYPLSTGVPTVPPYSSAPSASSSAFCILRASNPHLLGLLRVLPRMTRMTFIRMCALMPLQIPIIACRMMTICLLIRQPHYLSLDSSRSEYLLIIDCICGLFPQAVGIPPVDPPPWSLFESFFAEALEAQTPLAFNWFERVRTSLIDADSRMATWLATGRSDRLFITLRHNTYAVHGPHAAGRAVPVNESLLAHYDKPLWPSLQVGFQLRDLMVLETSFRAQSESLSYVMWVLSGLLGFSHVQRFAPYLIRWLQRYPRAWRISCMSRLPTPHTPAISDRSFICPAYQLTLGIRKNVRCWRLLWYLWILFLGRKISASFWILPALHLHCVHNKPWSTWHLGTLHFLCSPSPL